MQIPAIGFGTGTALRDKDATDYVVQAIETGFSHIDTAQSLLRLVKPTITTDFFAVYHNEASVGDAIRESALSRTDLFVTTKYSTGPIQESVRESLARVKYLESYFLDFLS